MKVFYRRHSRADVVVMLRRRVDALCEALPVRRLVLFGSYALDRHTVASDVDLLVVYDDPPRDDAFTLVKNTVAVPRLEPHVYTVAQYDRLRPVIDRMIEDGIEIEVP